jgi:hypothetical protein
MKNSDKIILDLCGGTGAWSKPYYDAGYTVFNVTLPQFDVRSFVPPESVYGVLAAPPCTHFSIACNRLWKQKDADGRTFEDITILTACLMIIAKCEPIFWAIENPIGRTRKLLGKPALIFSPCDYGDPWTKRTCLWGIFNQPAQNPVLVSESEKGRNKGWLYKLGGTSEKTKRLRSITPPGFATAFFKANQ